MASETCKTEVVGVGERRMPVYTPVGAINSRPQASPFSQPDYITVQDTDKLASSIDSTSKLFLHSQLNSKSKQLDKQLAKSYGTHSKCLSSLSNSTSALNKRKKSSTGRSCVSSLA